MTGTTRQGLTEAQREHKLRQRRRTCEQIRDGLVRIDGLGRCWVRGSLTNPGFDVQDAIKEGQAMRGEMVYEPACPRSEWTSKHLAAVTEYAVVLTDAGREALEQENKR